MIYDRNYLRVGVVGLPMFLHGAAVAEPLSAGGAHVRAFPNGVGELVVLQALPVGELFSTGLTDVGHTMLKPLVVVQLWASVKTSLTMSAAQLGRGFRWGEPMNVHLQTRTCHLKEKNMQRLYVVYKDSP